MFEDAGGRVVKKFWPPIVTPDYTPYIAQLSGVDAVVQGFAGSNPLKFMKQYKDAGIDAAGDRRRYRRRRRAAEEFRRRGDRTDHRVGLHLRSRHSGNKQFIAGMVRDTGAIPGLYAAGLYINGMVAEAALKATDGNTDDKDALIKALRAVSLTDRREGRSTSTISATSLARSTSAAWRKGRQAGTDHDQDLSERQPVLDL